MHSALHYTINTPEIMTINEKCESEAKTFASNTGIAMRKKSRTKKSNKTFEWITKQKKQIGKCINAYFNEEWMLT